MNAGYKSKPVKLATFNGRRAARSYVQIDVEKQGTEARIVVSLQDSN